MKPAVFLDKDGTLIDDVPYNVDPALITLAPGAREGVRALAAAGYALIVVTNQSGIARGLFEAGALQGVRDRMMVLFGANFDDFRHCPHGPDDGCACRKPLPGMLVDAAREHGIDLASSWMVGDILNDVEAGRRAGCRTILIDNGNETQWVDGPFRRPHHRVATMGQAANIILAAERLAA